MPPLGEVAPPDEREARGPPVAVHRPQAGDSPHAKGGDDQVMSTSADRGDAPRLIGSYSSYGEAQRAVDTLSDRGFPVELVTIVGSDLRLVERVTGRRTVARAALAGAGSGAWFGLLVGLVFWIVSPWAVGAVVSGVLLGLAFGAVFAAIA